MKEAGAASAEDPSKVPSTSPALARLLHSPPLQDYHYHYYYLCSYAVYGSRQEEPQLSAQRVEGGSKDEEAEGTKGLRGVKGELMKGEKLGDNGMWCEGMRG